ncbi:TPA: site-specific DNA-methyltransferase, partial [Escherichia coli]
PVNDIKSLIAYLSNTDDLIVDFFAGSGTSGHSVFLQNAKDHVNRRFILVQLPEPLNHKNKEQEIAYNFL